MMTATEALIGAEYDDPLKREKRNARFLCARYEFQEMRERREVAEECHAGRVYRLFVLMTSRVSNDRAVVSVLTDGTAFWGWETVEAKWEAAFLRPAYWMAAKMRLEHIQARKAAERAAEAAKAERSAKAKKAAARRALFGAGRENDQRKAVAA